ncbi:MAG: bifunctional precorrin-2 dehydrogenase/sirohydrochlorin ferrochelatase [Acidobacteria bacterium]|nr:bifunctional precorrin-2 dehydrogenase/sirohydrochlorin ferrochelatase [Acidobacteriota bacterium]
MRVGHTGPPELYPVLIDLTERRVVVVGGGSVGAQKLRALVAGGAVIEVVSPEATAAVRALDSEGVLSWRQKPFEPQDLDGAVLVISAVNDPDVARAVWEAANERSILANGADDPAHCSFMLPAVHRDGDLVVAISTGGAAPAVATRLRDRIAAMVGHGQGSWLTFLRQFRPMVKASFGTYEERRDAWYRIVDSEAHARFQAGDHDGAATTISHAIGLVTTEGVSG